MIVTPPSFWQGSEYRKWTLTFALALFAHGALVWGLGDSKPNQEPIAMSAVMLNFAELPQSSTKIEPVVVGSPKEVTLDSAVSPNEPPKVQQTEEPKIVVDESPAEQANIVVKKQIKAKEQPKVKPKINVEPKEQTKKSLKESPQKSAKKSTATDVQKAKENISDLNSQATVQASSAPPKGDDSQIAAPSHSVAENKSLVQNWQARVLGHIRRYQSYPIYALNNKIEGTVLTAIQIDKQGNVLSASIRKSSGSNVLDNEALALAKRASPLPSPPAHLKDKQLTLPIPIRFNIEEYRKAKGR